MLEHAQAELPNECCGILAGVRDGDELIAADRHPLTNEAASPTEYLAADSLFAVHKTMRERGQEIVAIYHSHPTSAPIPSKKDLERNFYGDSVVHFIIGLSGAEPELRGWWLEEQTFESADWKILEAAE
jgi:proteasome lid subunit RPN8/RPN11